MNIYQKKQLLIDSIGCTNLDSTMCLFFYTRQRPLFTKFNKDNQLIKNIDKLKTDGKYYVSEIVINNVMRKPYLDIDHLYTTKADMKKDYKNVLTSVVNNIIKIFKNEYNAEIIAKDILLLDSSGKCKGGYKMSVHVIVSPKYISYYYTSSQKTDSSAIHLYSSLLVSDPTLKHFIDNQVYNHDVNLRIIGSCKDFGDDRVLIPINSTTFEPIKKITNSQTINYFLTIINENKTKLYTPIINQTTRTVNTIRPDKMTRTDCNRRLLKLVQKYHPSACLKGCNGYLNFNYEKRNEKCPITPEITHPGTNGFYVFERNNGYYLGCHSAKCKNKKPIHIGYVDYMDSFIDSAIKVNTAYLTNNKIVKNAITDFIDNKKVLVIKSPMGTGKTCTIDNILAQLRIKTDGKLSVLWLTHRISVADSSDGSFHQFGFVNYQDVTGNMFDFDKIIIQIDSLFRACSRGVFNINHIQKFRRYGLVIIDECEGALNHFSSPFLNKNGKNSRTLFDTLMTIIKNSNKLLLLDADLHARSKLLMDQFSNNVNFIYNEFLPIERFITMTNSKIKYLEQLFFDAKNGLILFVVSMCSTLLEFIYNKLIEMKIAAVLHTAKTDDKLKIELKNVNDFWSKFQIICYSPTIESGISYDVKDRVDKTYSIIQDGYGTCSQRSHIQQLGRPRHVKDTNIYCLYENLPVNKATNGEIYFPLNEALYTENDVTGYYKHIEAYHGRQILQYTHETIVNDNSITISPAPKKLELFDQIMIHNEVEEVNKNHKVFLTVFNKVAMRANYTLKFDYVANNKKPKSDITPKYTDKIINADVSQYIDNIDINIKLFKNLQKTKQLSTVDKVVLDKLLFIQTFKISADDVADKNLFSLLVKKFYGCEFYLHKYGLLFGYIKINDTNIISDVKEYGRVDIIKDIINIILKKKYLNLKPRHLNNKTFSQLEFKEALFNISTKSEYFISQEDNRFLFGQPKGNLPPLNKKTQRAYTLTIQSLLKDYGVKFCSTGRIRVQNTKKTKSTREYIYCLSVDEQIKKIFDN